MIVQKNRILFYVVRCGHSTSFSNRATNLPHCAHLRTKRYYWFGDVYKYWTDGNSLKPGAIVFPSLGKVVCDHPGEEGGWDPAGEGGVERELGPVRSADSPRQGEETVPGEGPPEVEAHGGHPAEHGDGGVVEGVAEAAAGDGSQAHGELARGSGKGYCEREIAKLVR